MNLTRSLLVLSITLGLAQPLIAAEPVARWEFQQEETSKLIAVGGVHRDVPGPRPPEFPDMEQNNLAVKLDGMGARYVLEDPGPASPFDFDNADTIALEAWVKLDDIKPGENSYIVGKGRTGNVKLASHNQNWALRLREVDGKACVSFLFATLPAKEAARPDAHWHRWTTNTGFGSNTGWHHIAVNYKFGEPASMRGWIDGQRLAGKWDMGGETKEPPMVDDDAIWIGSSQGGEPANSFRGMLDNIVIYRETLTDAIVASKFKRVGKPTEAKQEVAKMPAVGPLPDDNVLATFSEGHTAHDRWLVAGQTTPQEVSRWLAPAMILPRLPFRYDASGVRDSWAAPVVARLAVDCSLEPGERTFLVRSRGMSRLWVNGQLVAVTKPHIGSSDGHQPVSPIPQPPLPGLRAVGYEMQEVAGQASIQADGQCQIIFETLVGGKNFRAEPGETLVAVQSSDRQSYHLVHAGKVDLEPIPLTDVAIEEVLTQAELSLEQQDRTTRRAAASNQAAFWQKRHDIARQEVKALSPSVPQNSHSHPIDAFLAERIEQRLVASNDSPEEVRRFHSTVHTLLKERCFRCHGEKRAGGLKLTSREAVLAGGDSGSPGMVPGDANASEIMARIRSNDDAVRMPPQGARLTESEIEILETWVRSGAHWPAQPVAKESVTLAPLIDDASFLRRVSFDTIGLPPTENDVRSFLADSDPDKRSKLIDRLLADDRGADHWVSYWQDVLAENPNMLKPSLNNTGPFRWFLYESFLDNKPLDRLVTELVLLLGSEREGGAAGFGLAADNDAPFAAKAQILGQAFLGIDLQCARCHDSPYHITTQQDLYSLAAMLERKAVTVPKSSTVPLSFFEKQERASLIQVTLKPGRAIAPVWPFAEVTGQADDASLDQLLSHSGDARERLAALITSPRNQRFAQVMANRVWRRLIGAGIVEPVHDWEGHAPSHPELLQWLASKLVAHGYDLKHLMRTIMTSQLYQRQAIGNNLAAMAEDRHFNAPDRRRLTAEQVVDSLFSVAGQAMDTEEITFDPDGRRPADTMISLGFPQRAWQLASLSNERDRPSLSLPKAQAICDVLEAFGWTGSRQNPRTDRESEANVLQPGVMANSLVSVWITRASAGGSLADMAVTAASADELTTTLFVRILGRMPTEAEKIPLMEVLKSGFDSRIVPESDHAVVPTLKPLSRVTWSNHLVAEANAIKVEMEHRARTGPMVDRRLKTEWREAYEDVVWALVNHPEFVWLP